MKNVPMMSHYCRRCNAAIMSTTQYCPMCGLHRPVYESLSSIEKKYIISPPTLPKRFEHIAALIEGKKGLFEQLPRMYKEYLGTSDSYIHKLSLTVLLLGFACFALATGLGMASSGIAVISSFILQFGLFCFVLSISYLFYDFIHFLRACQTSFMMAKLQVQGGTSPYSVHFKIERVLDYSLKNLATLLNTFYDKPWEQMAQQMDITLVGDTFVQSTKALSAKIKKFAGISLETMTLLWKNNVYAITSMTELNFDEKINHLNLKIREGEAIVLRYCWLRQLEFAHEFLESFLSGNSGRTRDEDRKYVVEGMQLGTMGPLSEPFYADCSTAPYELPFIMRFFWHQQLRPGNLPQEEITTQYPETSEFFESFAQVRNLIGKMEQQKLIDSASHAIGSYSPTNEFEVASEASQIKGFKISSQYFEIPNFQTSDKELYDRIDKLNAQMRVY